MGGPGTAAGLSQLYGRGSKNKTQRKGQTQALTFHHPSRMQLLRCRPLTDFSEEWTSWGDTRKPRCQKQIYFSIFWALLCIKGLWAQRDKQILFECFVNVFEQLLSFGMARWSRPGISRHCYFEMTFRGGETTPNRNSGKFSDCSFGFFQVYRFPSHNELQLHAFWFSISFSTFFCDCGVRICNCFVPPSVEQWIGWQPIGLLSKTHPLERVYTNAWGCGKPDAAHDVSKILEQMWQEIRAHWFKWKQRPANALVSELFSLPVKCPEILYGHSHCIWAIHFADNSWRAWHSL